MVRPTLGMSRLKPRDSGRSIILQIIKLSEILKHFLFQNNLKYKSNYG